VKKSKNDKSGERNDTVKEYSAYWSQKILHLWKRKQDLSLDGVEQAGLSMDESLLRVPVFTDVCRLVYVARK
jgi:hypothetical protein